MYVCMYVCTEISQVSRPRNWGWKFIIKSKGGMDICNEEEDKSWLGIGFANGNERKKRGG